MQENKRGRVIEQEERYYGGKNQKREEGGRKT